MVHVIDAASKWCNIISDGPISDWSGLLAYGPNAQLVSWTQLLISKMSHTCKEICDIKRRHKLKSIAKTSSNTFMDEGQTNPNCTQEPDNNNSAREGSDDGGNLGDTYSSCSTQYHHEPNSHDTPSHHAPSLPSPSPVSSGSTPMPPASLSPSPTSKIETLIPSSPL